MARNKVGGAAAGAFTRLEIIGVFLAAVPCAAQVPVRGPTAAAARAAVVPATPIFPLADLDSTTPPCHDFYQYATGGWYRRMEQANDPQLIRMGMDPAWAGYALRNLVAKSPTLATTTKDFTLRVVGDFYGSCLADRSGMAEGTVGDTNRANYCFRTTRQYLDRALFELLMEYVWPPAARAQSRRFLPNAQAAAIELFQASTTLDDAMKEQLVEVTKAQKMHAQPGSPNEATELWPANDSSPSSEGHGPTDLPFMGKNVAASWIYRDYSVVKLSPTDFRKNVEKLQAAPDTVSLPVWPDGGNSFLLNVVLTDTTESYWGVVTKYLPEYTGSGAQLKFGMYIPPIVDGQVDMAAWYGMVGPGALHELVEGAYTNKTMLASSDRPFGQISPEARAAFAQEQFHGQLQGYAHPFIDHLGALLTYYAFKQALKEWPQPTIEGFTPEQRLFLGMAWGVRGGEMRLDPQGSGPARWRTWINGALSALPGFAQAFGCKAGDPMAGGHIWYQAPWYNTVLRPNQRDSLAATYDRSVTGYLQSVLDGPRTEGDSSIKITLTVEQQAAFTKGRAAFDAQRRAILGEPGKASRVGTTERLYQLIGQEIASVRAVLLPGQKKLFNLSAQQLMQRIQEQDDPEGAVTERALIIPGDP